MSNAFEREVMALLNKGLEKIEDRFVADAITFYGPLIGGADDLFKRRIEEMRAHCQANQKSARLLIILTTVGGSVEIVERIVNTIRHHYDEVNFLVPDYAYSAGTVFCMSGDNIYMDYYSVLGPIDPQVQNKDGDLVSVQGYLDKVVELLDKSRSKDGLSDAEFLILKDFDLARLRMYERAKALTGDLLKKWLVKYKFKNWTEHSSNGQPVTDDEKVDRADAIAKALGAANVWNTHSRPISSKDLMNMKLKIEDYSCDLELRRVINQYYDVLKDFIEEREYKFFFHARGAQT